MRIVYVLLSPTFGMHQYTADLANRMTADEVHLVTTQQFPRDRYAPWVTLHTPARTTNTGLSAEILHLPHLRLIGDTIARLAPDLVHFTGPHLWNVPLVRRLKGAGIPVLHTIHDLDPHSGTRFGFLLHLWNRAIIRSADHILLHGEQYRQRLIRQGVPATRVTHTPLLHLFLSHVRLCQLEQGGWQPASAAADQPFTLLFFGRLERYKGITHLLTAFTQLRELSGSRLPPVRLILAGPGQLAPLWPAPLPAGVELRNHLITDDEAVALFQAADLVLLPYADASQSALVASAGFFGKPVLVTRAGALAEYVEEGVTGLVTEPAHPASLARRLAEAVSRPQQMRQMGLAGRARYERQRAAESADLHALCHRLARHS